MDWVPLAVMPQGVEHIVGACMGLLDVSRVPLAVMPQGVEHVKAMVLSLGLSSGAPRRDAARR